MSATPQPKPKKIVYLFGAGATHAELTNLYEDLSPRKLGLLTTNVSDRVLGKARRRARYLKGVEMVSATSGSLKGVERVSGTSGSLNIELLISLIENSKIHGWEYKTQHLKRLVKEDIKSILTPSRTRRFYLHKALFEFHKHVITMTNEAVLGFVSLNYDDVLDQAYEQYYGKPMYCFSLEQGTPTPETIPLLKLHGSFNWTGKIIRGRRRTIEIIPLGSSKNYLHAPYGFIWNRTLEILIECDTLRVIGCSLSQNDAHLIDLLFKAHLERGQAFDMEIIGPESTGENIQKNYGFFPAIKRLTEIESGLISEPNSGNPFKTWLKYKGTRMLKETIEGTRFLKKVCV